MCYFIIIYIFIQVHYFTPYKEFTFNKNKWRFWKQSGVQRVMFWVSKGILRTDDAIQLISTPSVNFILHYNSYKNKLTSRKMWREQFKTKKTTKLYSSFDVRKIII